jgi:hypothetical protein
MGLYLVVNDNPPHDIATATGWGYVVQWANSLDLHDYEEIVRFIEHGHSTDLPRLASELSTAIRKQPPRRRGTKGIVRDV